HVPALAIGRAAFRDDARHIAVIEQLGVTLFVEGADVGHEILAAAAAIGPVATRAVALVDRLPALGISRRRRGGDDERANASPIYDAPPAPFALCPAWHRSPSPIVPSSVDLVVRRPQLERTRVDRLAPIFPTTFPSAHPLSPLLRGDQRPRCWAAQV